jgi:hypothetical protein
MFFFFFFINCICFSPMFLVAYKKFSHKKYGNLYEIFTNYLIRNLCPLHHYSNNRNDISTPLT